MGILLPITLVLAPLALLGALGWHVVVALHRLSGARRAVARGVESLGIRLEPGAAFGGKVRTTTADGIACGGGPGTVARFALSAPDVVVCEPDRVEALFGPFPPPRLETRDVDFDARYVVVCRAPDRSGAGYRDVPIEMPECLRSPIVRKALVDARIHELKVHDGSAELVLEDIEEGGVACAVALARTLRAPGAAPPPPHRPALAPPFGVADRSRIVAILVAAFFVTLLLALPIATPIFVITAPPSIATVALLSGGDAVVCAEGEQVIQVSRFTDPSCVSKAWATAHPWIVEGGKAGCTTFDSSTYHGETYFHCRDPIPETRKPWLAPLRAIEGAWALLGIAGLFLLWVWFQASRARRTTEPVAAFIRALD